MRSAPGFVGQLLGYGRLSVRSAPRGFSVPEPIALLYDWMESKGKLVNTKCLTAR